MERTAGVAQLVEHNVANVVVVGSNPITRSKHESRRKSWLKSSEYRGTADRVRFELEPAPAFLAFHLGRHNCW